MKETIQAHKGSNQPFDKKLYDAFMDKRFTMSDLMELNKAISYRTVNHWNEKGYLFSKATEGEWRKFSFTEYMWILFLNELRDLGVSFKKVLTSVFIGLGIEHYTLNEMDEKQLSKLKGMEFEKLMQKIDKALVSENFCLWLISIVSYKTPMTIRFFKDGSSLNIYGNPEYHGIKFKPARDEYLSNLEESNFHSSISISIDSLIKDYIVKKDLDNISELKLLSKTEIEILEHVRNNDLNEVIVKAENGKHIKINLTGEVSEADVSKRIKESFFSSYQECEYKTHGGKVFHVKRVAK